MQLLNDRLLKTDNSIKLMELLYKSLIGYHEGNFIFNFVNYNEFKNIIHKFIIETIGLFLCDSKYSDDTYDVYIKDFRKSIHGFFINDNNTIYINEKIIRNMYDGDIEKFISILHELNHFKIKYDILDGKIDFNICRVVKERLLRDEDRDPFNEIGDFKSLKGKTSRINDFYYNRNYNNFSEEVFVNICAKQDFIFLMKTVFINYNKTDNFYMDSIDKVYDDLVKNDLVRYDNYNRDFSLSLSFNSNFLDFDEAFDISVKYHPMWLAYPQISIEYYLDNDGYVKKKNLQQLIYSMDNSSDDNEKIYIQYLIDNLDKKRNDSNKR